MPTLSDGDMQAAAIENRHRDLHAFAFLAQPVGDRHARIVERHVAHIRALLAHLLLGLADGDARRRTLDDEGGKPFGPGVFGRCAPSR
jgi:hypothetical protein